MEEEIAQKLSTLVNKRLNRLFQVPRGFPNVQFDWVTEDDLRNFTRIEASAPGSWELPHGREISNVILKAEIAKQDHVTNSWATLEAEFGFGPHTIHATARFPGDFEFVAHLTNSSLERFLAAMAPESDLLDRLPAFWFREADLVFNPATVAFEFQGEVDGEWLLPIGPDGLALGAIGISLSREPGRPIATPLEGEIRGAVFINDNAIPLAHALSEPLAFTGECERLDAAELIHQLCDSSVARRVPLLYQQLLGPSVVTVSLDSNSISVESDAIGNFGATELVIENRDGFWGYSVAPELPEDWRLSRLAPFLTELDALSATNPMLAISAFAKPPVELFPEWPDDLDDQLRSGVNLVMPVAPRGLPELEFLAEVCRINHRLRLAGALVDGDGGRELILESPLDRFRIADGFEITDPVLRIRQQALRSYGVTVSGPVRVRIGIHEWLDFKGEAQVEPGVITLKANLAAPWESPWGLRNATVGVLSLRVVLRAGVEEPEIRLVGRGSIRNCHGSVRIRWDRSAETQQVRFAFDLLPAGLVIQELGPVGQSVGAPAWLALDAGFGRVLITATPDSHAMQGELSLLGRQGEFVAAIGASRPFLAFGGIEAFRWLRVAGGRHVFEMTRGEPGALAEIAGPIPFVFPDSAEGPLVRISADGGDRPGIQLVAEVTLFTEFTQQVVAEITKKGVVFLYAFDNRRTSLNLDCRVEKDCFYADGEASSKLDFQVDLIEPKSGVRLASTRIEGLMRFKLSLTIGASFEAVISGGLVWRDHELAAPKFTLTETPTAFSDLESAMEDALRERLYAMLLRSELGSPAAFFTAAREGWLQTGRSIGLRSSEFSLALKNALGATPDELTVALRDFGYSWSEIVEALSVTNRLGVEPVAKPLRRAGASAPQIAFAVRTVFAAGPDNCAMALRGADFSFLEIATALKLGCEAGPAPLTRALRLVGCRADELASALRTLSPTPAAEAYRCFRDAGFKAAETVKALRAIYETNREFSQQLLEQAGYSPREVRGAIHREFEELGGIFG